MTDERDERLRAAIRNAYENAPAFRARMDEAGVGPDEIQGVADLHRIPVLPKDRLIALQQEDPPFGGMLAIPREEVRHIFFSPGPLYEPDGGEDRSHVATAEAALRASGFGAGDTVLNCLSYHLVPAGLMLDRALVNLGCTVVPGGPGNSALQLKMMGDLGVTGYVGTPSFLKILIDQAEEMGLDFRAAFRLTKAFVTAEPLPAGLLRTFTQAYGLSVGNGYATAELGFLALNTGDGMAMGLLPDPIVQVVDPDSGQSVGAGEAGEVVVTNFSDVYPLIRLGTGDLALNLDPNPGASRQEERAIILVGRRGEAVKVRGMFVHPNQLRFAVAPHAAGRVQGVVTRPGEQDRFTVRIATAVLPDEKLAETIRASVNAACRVRVDQVQFLPEGALADDAPGMVDERDLY